MMANFLETVDDKLAELLSDWNLYTIILAISLCAVIGYTLWSTTDPDIHPMVLMRQASAGRVRNPGESAVYRSPQAPEGMPLRTGLAVKLPTDPPYSGGRDGDIRFVWRRVTGEFSLPPGLVSAPATPKKQEILTVLGQEQVHSHTVEELSNEIAIVGDHLLRNGGKRVAVYLPNSIEFLSTVFGMRVLH
jgi:hypothetical protein